MVILLLLTAVIYVRIFLEFFLIGIDLSKTKSLKFDNTIHIYIYSHTNL